VPFLDHLTFGHTILLLVCLAIAFGYECVNGFHDTANAVATVIYTKSLRPWTAVVWSGLWNFIGVHAGGIAVAYSIVHLLPVDLLVNIDTTAGLAMVLSLLVAAMIWNAGTWYLGLPASSSHALIGAILGIGLMNSFLEGKGLGTGVNWSKAQEVGLSLVISPLIGFFAAAALLLLARKLLAAPHLFEAPGDQPPPRWIRGILIFTCTGVSFAHGSNDGQKGMGLIMLILIGIIPAHYALNLNLNEQNIADTRAAARQLDGLIAAQGAPTPTTLPNPAKPEGVTARQWLAFILNRLEGKTSYTELQPAERWEVRTAIIELESIITRAERELWQELTQEKRKIVDGLRGELRGSVEYVPEWVKMGVALALGLGTMVGWKRIVVTVGEKIGKTHLTYAQGAAAEIVAMSTIGLADFEGMPVSTTHVLSSSVAGTMWANQSGLQMATIRNIALAWVLTLPAAMLLSAGLFGLCAWLIV
jgi:PiT family inorganic phosphate transporter